ncbi:PilZ domain-containing protein [Anaeromyxobacter oryzae]|uniref:PilZ domain-containing protein n=1 Tax=Anaeromyxobacter oryzae TaxID=2918170 RepID=A0ABM7WV01_9BACT|nr:PilZ domain-containing protein [Anaeromyxobacter oryzae]BDG03328.1 hypothetical protein AMOR_23240 [Anaeromyxobacter oryzae]
MATNDVPNPRRAPRVPVRLPVEVRHRFSTWRADTEDLGPRGCQLVTPRLVAPGRDVKLRIDCAVIGREVRVAGTVIWSRPQAPSRLGVAFDASETDRAWFETLLEADPAAARAARRAPDVLARATRVHLGAPPRLVVDFTADEVTILRRIGAGVTVDALVRSFGASSERLLGALFSLVARRLVVLDPAEATGPLVWRGVLEQADTANAAQAVPDTPRSSAAQRLYDEGLSHLAAGRIQLAARRFADALAAAPSDHVIQEQLERIARWA